MEISEDHEYVVCKKPIGALPKATMGEKGSASINKPSKERNYSLNYTAGQQVHQECCRKYCAPNQIANALSRTVQRDIATNTGQKILRSAETQFKFSTDCFFVVNQQYLEEREKCQMLFLSGQLKQETQLECAVPIFVR